MNPMFAGTRTALRAILLGMLLLYSLGACAAGPCARIMDNTTGSGVRRPITAQDLIGLADIGFNHNSVQDSPLAVSNDGRRIAFVLTKADSQENTYCQTLMITRIDSNGSVQTIDTGGDIILTESTIRGVVVTVGAPKAILPKWSPDDKAIAYLKRVSGVTQVAIVPTTGDHTMLTTSFPRDVDDVEWNGGDATLAVTVRAARSDADGGPAEYRSGYIYDYRFYPNAANRPQPIAPAKDDCFILTVDVGKLLVRPGTGCASFTRQASVDPASSGEEDGPRARVINEVAPAVPGRPRLLFESRLGARIMCNLPACEFGTRPPLGVWLREGSVYFLRREGWGDSVTSLYRWRPGFDVQNEFSTEDVIAGCKLALEELVCIREGSTSPGRIEAISLDGHARTIVDPNPQFGNLILGRVIRLHWRNVTGFQCFGDLVLPPGVSNPHLLPLIVVQYRTRGFLRGGLGDEYPIQLFAQRGFAVLSIDSPPPFYTSLKGRSWPDWHAAERVNNHYWSERRSNLSSMITGIKYLESRHIVDPNRIGITGLSDGATTVQFAVAQYPKLFAAASVSTGFMERLTDMAFSGTAFADELKSEGYPPLSRIQSSFWKPVSIGVNAAALNTPILMNIADSELNLAVEDFSILRSYRKPVEMFIYPDEFHLKWQPAHRASIYERNVDWFDFWLGGFVDSDPQKRSQYIRWAKLQALRKGGKYAVKPKKQATLRRQPNA